MQASRSREESANLAADVAGMMIADAVAEKSGGKRLQNKRKSRTSKSRTRDKSRIYPCSECDRIMASAAALHYHRRKHSGVKPFACSQCPRRFIIRGQLVEHERIHSGEKPFACEQCAKRFAQSSQLRQHASVHSEVGTHVCPKCGEAFARPWRLQSHLRAAHEETTSQKRYRCEDCGREYSLRQSWVYHRLTHSDVRPFQCNLCSRQFRIAAQLRQHANHCRGRKTVADPPTAVDPNDQPPQNWMWFSAPTSVDLLEPAATGQVILLEDNAGTSLLDSSGFSTRGSELVGSQYQQL